MRPVWPGRVPDRIADALTTALGSVASGCALDGKAFDITTQLLLALITIDGRGLVLHAQTGVTALKNTGGLIAFDPDGDLNAQIAVLKPFLVESLGTGLLPCPLGTGPIHETLLQLLCAVAPEDTKRLIPPIWNGFCVERVDVSHAGIGKLFGRSDVPFVPEHAEKPLSHPKASGTIFVTMGTAFGSPAGRVRHPSPASPPAPYDDDYASVPFWVTAGE